MSIITENINFSLPFNIMFSLNDGSCTEHRSTKRMLSQMKGMFFDSKTELELIEKEDPVIYEFYELGAPAHPGDISFGTSIVYPGKIGDEFYMTKGHFHSIIDTGEVYYCIQGKGAMLLEDTEGNCCLKTLEPGLAVYCPKRFAHRSINTGTEKLVTFYAYRADAGHDYKTIETKGYRKLVLEKDGEIVLADNPRWKEEKNYINY